MKANERFCCASRLIILDRLSYLVLVIFPSYLEEPPVVLIAFGYEPDRPPQLRRDAMHIYEQPDV